jgi:hypothetical protein
MLAVRLLIGFSAVVCAVAARQWAGAQPAGAAAPSVVELFTSQGCSSCPPAEAVLGRLAARPGVIALAYHVDYWDSGAWRDRYSIPQAVRRQANYVHSFGLPSAFTPQAVIGGRASAVGSSEQQILRALPAAAAGVPVDLAVEGDSVAVTVPQAQAEPCDVNLAVYRSHASTAVGGGENSGRTLEEFGIVRQFTTLGQWKGARRTFTVPLSSLPGDADRVAVLLQQSNQGAILGAASIALP